MAQWIRAPTLPDLEFAVSSPCRLSAVVYFCHYNSRRTGTETHTWCRVQSLINQLQLTSSTRSEELRMSSRSKSRGQAAACRGGGRGCGTGAGSARYNWQTGCNAAYAINPTATPVQISSLSKTDRQRLRDRWARLREHREQIEDGYSECVFYEVEWKLDKLDTLEKLLLC